MSEVGKTLLRVQVFVALDGPVATGLRGSVVPVLNHKQTRILVGAHHEWKVTLSRWRTCVFAAEVNEVWS